MRQRGQIGIVLLVVLGLALVGLFAICNGPDDDDELDGLGRITLISHERDRCWDDECYDDGGGGDYGDDWNSDQRNHNRRNRGAFSPGPFEDSPVDAFNGNVICLPGSYCTPEDRGDDEEQR